MMPDDTQQELAPESRGSPPRAECPRTLSKAPACQHLILQFKGFGGGVPPNTETAAVNPRAGIK